MKTKLFTALLAAGAIGMAAAPMTSVAAASTQDAQGTLIKSVPEVLSVHFPAGSTTSGELNILSNQTAEFSAMQPLNVMSNYNKPQFQIKVSPGELSTPSGTKVQMLVKSDHNSFIGTAFKTREGTPNQWTTVNMEFKSQPITYPQTNAHDLIAGDYKATVNYRVVSSLLP